MTESQAMTVVANFVFFKSLNCWVALSYLITSVFYCCSTKKGWLCKRYFRVNRWSERYFVLSKEKLIYYTSDVSAPFFCSPPINAIGFIMIIIFFSIYLLVSMSVIVS
jgi:hypothetical protein